MICTDALLEVLCEILGFHVELVRHGAEHVLRRASLEVLYLRCAHVPELAGEQKGRN